MTFTKNRKSLGALALALAITASLSVSAFAQDGSTVPMIKTVPSTTALAAEPGEIPPMIRIVPSTTALAAEPGEITESSAALGGVVTWELYDGKAIACTPAAIIGQKNVK